MMQYQTEKGTVSFEPNVFGMIAMDTALNREEIYAVTNARGKIMHPLKTGRENTGFVEVEPTGRASEIDMKIYVILNFGKSISAVAADFGRAVREKVFALTGVTVRHLTMMVTGVKSRKIARRELEIPC